MMKVNITRRSFIGTLVSLCLTCFIKPVHAVNILVNKNLPDDLGSKLTNFFIQKESARLIGKEYLKSAPEEANIKTLIDLICSYDSDWRFKLAQADMRELRKLLLYQQRKDFEHGRIIKVQGWILSETEVRLCALSSVCI